MSDNYEILPPSPTHPTTNRTKIKIMRRNNETLSLVMRIMRPGAILCCESVLIRSLVCSLDLQWPDPRSLFTQCNGRL